MRTIALTLLTILTLASCQKQGANASLSERPKEDDSLAWKVTVLPVEDCLPIYYARETGIFDSLDVDVRLLEYASMLDADTALYLGHAQAGYTSLPRIIVYEREQKAKLHDILPCPGRYWLVTAPRTPHDSIAKMGERMVALSRYTQADYWSDMLMDEAKMRRDSIFRPQVNDLWLRTDMVCDSLLDAAMLPNPMAAIARRKGCKMLAECVDTLHFFNCIATHKWAPTDTLRLMQQERFLQALRVAAKRINARPASAQGVIKKHFVRKNEAPASFTLPLFPFQADSLDVSRRKANEWFDSRQLKP